MIVLSIAGSDPSSGAGIQADLKTFLSSGVYGVTVLTAVTSQNTSKFFKIQEISSNMISSQLESVFSDFKIDAIKIGMVYSSSAIKAIHSKLKMVKIPIILDPVFESSTGGALIQKSALSFFKKLLLPLSFVVTPNIPEAETLAAMKIKNNNDIKKAAYRIQRMGARNVIIKGGHFGGKIITDFVLDGAKFYSLSAKKIERHTHGGGCNFSAALAISLAKGNTLKDATRFAKESSLQSIKNSQKIGKGLYIAKIIVDEIQKELAESISKFTNLENIYKHIPEVQTNFVFSRPNAKSLNDILGVSGRIVKDGHSVIVAGTLNYGGSKHVGSAVLEMAKKFPEIRSAINVKYDKEIIKKAILKKFSVLHYERALEPHKTKNKEGQTVSWGIKKAIKNARKPADLIFHKGERGKEPMILIFGRTPSEVLDKLKIVI